MPGRVGVRTCGQAREQSDRIEPRASATNSPDLHSTPRGLSHRQEKPGSRATDSNQEPQQRTPRISTAHPGVYPVGRRNTGAQRPTRTWTPSIRGVPEPSEGSRKMEPPPGFAPRASATKPPDLHSSPRGLSRRQEKPGSRATDSNLDPFHLRGPGTTRGVPQDGASSGI